MYISTKTKFISLLSRSFMESWEASKFKVGVFLQKKKKKPHCRSFWAFSLVAIEFDSQFAYFPSRLFLLVSVAAKSHLLLAICAFMQENSGWRHLMERTIRGTLETLVT